MSEKIKSVHPLISATCFLVIIFIIISSMHWMADILNPFFISVLFAVIIMPFVKFLINKGLSPTLSLSISVFLVILFSIILFILLSFAAADVSQKIPEYNDRIIELYNSSLQYLESKGFNKTELEELNLLDPDKLFTFSVSFLKGLLDSFNNFFIVLLLTIFLLIELVNIEVKLSKSAKNEDSFFSNLNQLFIDLKKYLSISAFTGLIAGVGNVILFLVLGIDFAILLGFLSFLFSFIPNIGFVMTVVPPFIIALIKFGLLKALIVVLGITLINTVVDNIIKPKFIGNEFDMSLLVVFLSLLFWVLVLGPIGAILAVPLTLTFKRFFGFVKIYNLNNKN